MAYLLPPLPRTTTTIVLLMLPPCGGPAFTAIASTNTATITAVRVPACRCCMHAGVVYAHWRCSFFCFGLLELANRAGTSAMHQHHPTTAAVRCDCRRQRQKKKKENAVWFGVFYHDTVLWRPFGPHRGPDYLSSPASSATTATATNSSLQ